MHHARTIAHRRCMTEVGTPGHPWSSGGVRAKSKPISLPLPIQLVKAHSPWVSSQSQRPPAFSLSQLTPVERTRATSTKNQSKMKELSTPRLLHFLLWSINESASIENKVSALTSLRGDSTVDERSPSVTHCSICISTTSVLYAAAAVLSAPM